MIAFHCSDAIAERSLQMYHHNQHHKAWRAFLVVIATLIGLLAGRTGAHAQASDDPAVSANNAAENGAVAEAPGAPDDAASANSIDDSTVVPIDNADVNSPGPARASASNETSASGSEDSAVLELPQVIDPQYGSVAGEGPEGAVASRQGDDDDAANSGPAAPDTAALDSSATAAAQVGTLQDYESQGNQVPAGPIFFAPGVAVVRFPRPLLFNSPPRPLLGAPLARSPIILPPTSGGPFPSTSPMLMAPRVGIVGSFPRGGLMGFHR